MPPPKSYTTRAEPAGIERPSTETKYPAAATGSGTMAGSGSPAARQASTSFATRAPDHPAGWVSGQVVDPGTGRPVPPRP